MSLGAEPPSAGLGVLATLASVAAGTLVVYPLKSVAPVVSLGVVYLPAILLVSTVWGFRMGLFASLASAAAFNFFQIPPLHRFTIAEEENWVALAAFAIAALVSSTLAGLARARAVEAERRRQEADRALAELEALTRERDRMQAEAVEAEAVRRSDELKTALLRSVSHDLRTPLTSIIAGGTALGLAEPDRRRAPRAQRGGSSARAARLSRLVENLLDLSRLESGKAEPHREPGRPRRGAGGGARRGGAGGGFDPARGRRELPLVEADAGAARARLRQPARERASLRRRPSRSWSARVWSAAAIVVRVVDQGPGIPEGERERIFEPFQRGDAAGSGSGLGLAIARGFVEANGGEIAVESLPGQGSSFVVTLPPHEGEAA